MGRKFTVGVESTGSYMIKVNNAQPGDDPFGDASSNGTTMQFGGQAGQIQRVASNLQPIPETDADVEFSKTNVFVDEEKDFDAEREKTDTIYNKEME